MINSRRRRRGRSLATPRNLIVPIEMVNYGLTSSSATATTFANTSTRLNPAYYDGATYYLEIVAKNTNATTAYDIQLWNATTSANMLSDNSGSGLRVAAGLAAVTRLRSEAFTPSSGANIYQLVTPQTAANSEVEIYSARIIVVQVGATKTRIQYPLSVRTVGTVSTASGSAVSALGGTSYSQNLASFFAYYGLNKNVFGTVAGWDFEVCHCVGNASSVGTVGLFDVADADFSDPIATVSEAATLSPVVDVASFGNDVPGWTDGHEYTVFHKSSNIYNSNLFGASVYVTLSPLVRAEVPWRIGHAVSNATTQQKHMFARAKLDTASYSAPNTVYFEATGYCADNADITKMNDDDTADSGEGTSVVAINWNSATKARLRSAAVEWTSGDRTYQYDSVSTAAKYISGGFAVVRFG